MLNAPMAEPFTEMLKGGHHNSLGRAEEVVGIVLADAARLDELFADLGDPDESWEVASLQGRPPHQ